MRLSGLAIIAALAVVIVGGLTVIISGCQQSAESGGASDVRAAQLEEGVVHPAAAGAEIGAPAADSRLIAAATVSPDLVIAYTASIGGFLQPCGCAVQGGEMGGVARRATLVDSLEAAGTPMLLLEGGDFVGGTEGTGPRIAAASLEAMRAMGYDAVALGEAELALGESFLTKLAASGLPIAHANWSHPAVGPAQTEGLMLEAAGHKIGVVGILDARAMPPGFALENLTIEDPAPAAAAAARSLREAGAEVVLVLGHASFRNSGLMAAQAGAPDLWIVGHGGKELSEPMLHDGVLLLGPGHSGKMVGLIDLELGAAGEPRYAHRLHPLPASMPEQPAMAQLVEGLTPPAHAGT